MPLRFRCPCGQKFKTREELAGKRAQCRKCGRAIRVPQSTTYDTEAEVLPPRPRDDRREVQAETNAVAPATETAAAGDEAKARVVVADSIDDDIAAMVTLLSNHGYAVLQTADGAKALELIRNQRPDAAVLDVRLHGLSGFQVLQQLRNPSNPRNEKVWDLPVLMTTEKLRGRDKQYAMSLGVKGFYAKPVQPAKLCSRLEREIIGPEKAGV